MINPLLGPLLYNVRLTIDIENWDYMTPRSNQHPPQSLGASKHSSPCDRASPLATLPFTRSFTGAFLRVIPTRILLRLFIITYDLLFPRCTSALAGHKIQLALVLTVQPVEDAHIAKHVPRLASSRVNERAHADRTSICARGISRRQRDSVDRKVRSCGDGGLMATRRLECWFEITCSVLLLLLSLLLGLFFLVLD